MSIFDDFGNWLNSLISDSNYKPVDDNNSRVGDSRPLYGNSNSGDSKSSHGNSNPGGSSSSSGKYGNNDYLDPSYNPGGYGNSSSSDSPMSQSDKDYAISQIQSKYGNLATNGTMIDNLNGKFGGNDSGKNNVGAGKDESIVGDGVFPIPIGAKKNDEEKAKDENDATPDVVSTQKAKQEVPEWAFDQAVVAFMNSDNPYAEKYRKANGIDTFDWYNNYGKLAAEGGRDIWQNMITSDDNFRNAYLDDYGNSIDFDNDGIVTLDEAGRWYDNMKSENVVKGSLDFSSDDEIMQRIFGGLAGNGANNELVDALNMNETMDIYNLLANGLSLADIVKDGRSNMAIANDTGKTYAEAIGLDKLMKDKNASQDDIMAAIARMNNALKLDRLIDASGKNAESGEKSSVIDFGDAEQTAAAINSLMNNVAGGNAGVQLISDTTPVSNGDTVYNVATTAPQAYNSAMALNIANQIANTGGKDMKDDLAYLLLNNLGVDGQSLGDLGYGAWRSNGTTYKDPNASGQPITMADARKSSAFDGGGMDFTSGLYPQFFIPSPLANNSGR